MRNKSSVHAVTPVARVPRPFVTALRPLQAVLGVFWIVAATAAVHGCSDDGGADWQALLSEPPETLYVVFDEAQQDDRLPGITEALLGTALEVDQATLSNKSYDYFEVDAGELWYYRLSGAIRWRSSDYHQWGECPESEALEGLDGDALTAATDAGMEFLLSTGLVSLRAQEEIRFSGTGALVGGSGMVGDEGGFESHIITLHLKYERVFLGQPFFGGGSHAEVHLGCGAEIVGAEVLWRPILEVGAMSPDSEENLQAKWDKEVEAAVQNGLELVSVSLDDAEVRWFASSKSYRQARALPYRITPVELVENWNVEPGSEAHEPFASEFAVCIGDETQVDEGLLSISDLPNDHQDEEEGEEILPPEDCDETTCF